MFRLSWLPPALAATTLAATAAAQSPPAPGPDSTSGKSTSLSYRSPIEGYRPFTEETVMPWKDANDTAARLGGWREYAREARQPAAPSPAAPASAIQAPHADHNH